MVNIKVRCSFIDDIKFQAIIKRYKRELAVAK